MDLLGSILGSMEKPPSLGDAEKKKARDQRKLFERQQEAQKKKLADFREKIQKRIHSFITDGAQQKYKFEPMEKVFRAIVHEVADVAGLASFSFGHEEEDRYVMLWKKEFAPCDDELLAYRRGEEWDPEKAKALSRLKEEERLSEEADANLRKKAAPANSCRNKYRHLIGDAKSTATNRSYGFVSADNKRDRRTIEEVLADSRAKRMKTEACSSTQQTDETDTSPTVVDQLATATEKSS